MTDASIDLATDSDFDDLPRTLRREREARAREARERAARERDLTDDVHGSARTSDDFSGPAFNPAGGRGHTPMIYGDEPVPAVVTRFDVPFMRLVAFFMKAVFAAVPALIVLGVMLWFAGKGLQTYYPELIHTRILISFPNAS